MLCFSLNIECTLYILFSKYTDGFYRFFELIWELTSKVFGGVSGSTNWALTNKENPIKRKNSENLFIRQNYSIIF